MFLHVQYTRSLLWTVEMISLMLNNLSILYGLCNLSCRKGFLNLYLPFLTARRRRNHRTNTERKCTQLQPGSGERRDRTECIASGGLQFKAYNLFLYEENKENLI